MFLGRWEIIFEKVKKDFLTVHLAILILLRQRQTLDAKAGFNSSSLPVSNCSIERFNP